MGDPIKLTPSEIEIDLGDGVVARADFLELMFELRELTETSKSEDEVYARWRAYLQQQTGHEFTRSQAYRLIFHLDDCSEAFKKKRAESPDSSRSTARESSPTTGESSSSSTSSRSRSSPGGKRSGGKREDQSLPTG